MIRVVLPYHLRLLSDTGPELELEVPAPATLGRILDALEVRHPVLRGTVRDRVTRKRRPMLRFFACSEDITLEPPDAPLPAEVAAGLEPLLIVGAIAGG